MEKKDTISIIKELSKGFLNKKIDGALYSYVVEGLIRCNKHLGKRFEDLADFLAQYHPKPDMSELFGNKELKKKIREVFKL